MRNQKQSHSAEKRKRGDALGSLTIQLGAENQNDQRHPLATSKKFGEKVSQCRKKPVKPNLLCSSKDKALKTLNPKDGTLWKHPRLLLVG